MYTTVHNQTVNLVFWMGNCHEETALPQGLHFVNSPCFEIMLLSDVVRVVVSLTGPFVTHSCGKFGDSTCALILHLPIAATSLLWTYCYVS